MPLTPNAALAALRDNFRAEIGQLRLALIDAGPARRASRFMLRLGG